MPYLVLVVLLIIPALASARDVSAATAADWLRWSVSRDRYANGVADGYLESANDHLQAARGLGEAGRGYCPGRYSGTLTDLVILVRRYLLDYPSLQARGIPYALERILLIAYPCEHEAP